MERVFDKNKYLIATAFMMLFVINDLAFDFIFDFAGSSYISFGFTLLASIITFIGTKNIVKYNIQQKADKVTIFIKSNFDKWQVIFSMLDIICGVVSIISGFVVIGSVLKFVKILYVPTKVVVVANKSKTVVKTLTKFSLVWSASRILVKKEEHGMKTWIKNNKLTLGSCVVLGLLGGFAGFKLASIYLATIPFWADIVIGVLTAILVCVMVVLLGGDKVKQAVFRALSKTLNDDNYTKITELANSLLEQQEIHELAQAELDAEKKKAEEEKAKQDEEAKQTEEDKKAEEEKAQLEAQKRALIDAEKEKIKAEEIKG